MSASTPEPGAAIPAPGAPPALGSSAAPGALGLGAPAPGARRPGPARGRRRCRPLLPWLSAAALLAAPPSSGAALEESRWSSGAVAPEFDIDLDAPPEVRFTEVIRHFNSSIQRIYRMIDHAAVRLALAELSRKRGPEDEELMGEIAGMAEAANLPVYGLHVMQMVYELNTVMVPIFNFSFPFLEGLQGSFGCTGILAKSKSDGMVYHGRNLDFAGAKYLQDLVYIATFKRGGRELFRAQMLAAYSMPVTAMKPGPNGFSWEVNTRFSDHWGGNKELERHLFRERRTLNGWIVRKVLENADGYEAAVETLSTKPMAATIFHIVAGVRKGTILARDPDALAHQLTLGESNYDCREDYIIVTNFDFYFHDVKEWLDPTGGRGVGHPRRLEAQRVLNASADLTAEVVAAALSDFGVQAKDTIFRAVMNVETGLWNTSLPLCKECPRRARSGSGGSAVVGEDEGEEHGHREGDAGADAGVAAFVV